MSEAIRVNVGCGMTPTPGWLNLDNSPSVLLAAVPGLAPIVNRLPSEQRAFIAFCQAGVVRYADGRKSLPVRAGSVEVVYSSHMLEHLDAREVADFLAQVRRALRAPDGIVRLAVPDIRQLVERYLETGDADEFMKATLLGRERPRGMFARLRQLIVGDRAHLWMYDGESLKRLLGRYGFVDARIMAPGETTIPQPTSLDLSERADESVVVEARRGH